MFLVDTLDQPVQFNEGSTVESSVVANGSAPNYRGTDVVAT
jgi:hypothetical protein